MRLTRSGRRRAVVDSALAAYADWRSECVAVVNAELAWRTARPVDESLAFFAYMAALDREEDAAAQYARLMRRAGKLVEIGLEAQLAEGWTGTFGEL